MAQITHKNKVVHTIGELPRIGSNAPDFKLTKSDLSEVTLREFRGKRVVLNIFPSLDTGICATSVRRFNAEVEKMENTVVICASKDLPFAHKRFCTTEGLEKVISASEYKDHDFGNTYGVRMVDGLLSGLFARAVVVIDEQGKVIYTEQVPEIAQEPNYEAVEAVLK